MTNCHHCGSALSLTFIDLGTAPPSNAYVSAAALDAAETWYPLRVLVCEQCWLVQIKDYAGREALFTADYAYFSSFSTSWLRHSEQYVSMILDRLKLGSNDLVVEIAANDGYLLQYVTERGIPCLGVEPASGTARAARAKGIEVVEDFFGVDVAKRIARERGRASLLIANNVLAHVPDINDFVAGFPALMRPDGVATFEFPHLLALVRDSQFDTIYHEHYSYLSLASVSTIFAANGLAVFDVEEIPTHGGSLRVYAQRAESAVRPTTSAVSSLLAREHAAGVSQRSFYAALQTAAERIKLDLLTYLLEAKRRGLRVAAYGAAAKGNTLLNFAGVRSDLLPYVVDRNPAKQGGYLPGSRIPIVSEEHLKQDRPDRVLILPWNLADEIRAQLVYIAGWDGRFVTAVPRLSEFPVEA
jgi:SAM-dependent methyltransferase